MKIVKTMKLSFRFVEYDGKRYASIDDIVRTLDELAGEIDPVAAASVRALALKLAKSAAQEIVP